jgi:hypothetical protein
MSKIKLWRIRVTLFDDKGTNPSNMPSPAGRSIGRYAGLMACEHNYGLRNEPEDRIRARVTWMHSHILFLPRGRIQSYRNPILQADLEGQ